MVTRWGADWNASVGRQARAERPNPFRPLFATPVRSTVNLVLAVAATVSLFVIFTPVGDGLVPLLSVVAALALVAFAVQLGGRRSWLLYVSMIVTIFFAFLYSWPIQALLPTYLKTELGYSPGQVTDALYFAGFGTMAGCWLAGFAGDWTGTKKAYALTLLASLVFVFPVFAVRDNLPLLGTLLFVLQATSSASPVCCRATSAGISRRRAGPRRWASRTTWARSAGPSRRCSGRISRRAWTWGGPWPC